MRYLRLCFPLLLLGCTHPAAAQSDATPPNILVIIGDDMGVETLSSYGVGAATAVTPNLDQLAARGVRFERFWSQAACSPTRAAILTGRYGFRTGVVTPLYYGWSSMDPVIVPEPAVPAGSPRELDFTPRAPVPAGVDATMGTLPPGFPVPKGPLRDELMLPAILKSLPANYATAAIGKWHLADLDNGNLDHPNHVGFDYFSGTMYGSPKSYFAWRHVENGRLSAATGYVDSRAINDAKSWIASREDRPWFVWLGFTSPHTPLHLPPEELLRSNARELAPDEVSAENARPYFFAQIEAMDTLIGDLLGSMSRDTIDNTVVIFLGDNGTASWDQPPAPRDPRRVKMTVYEGGVAVPLIIAGPNIDGGQVRRPLAHAVDLFATIIELAGGTVADNVPDSIAIDSVSMTPYLSGSITTNRRDWVLTEITFGLALSRAIRNERYKLILQKGQQEFYDLENDPNEKSAINLTSLSQIEKANYEELRAIYKQLIEQPEAQ